jgi:formate hydrogenlyase transcriptional activator
MTTLTTVSDVDWCRPADRLAGEFSAELIGLSDDDITAAIEETQHRIGEALEVDRSTLVEFADDAVRATYHWASSDVPPVDLSAHVPRLLELLDRIGADGGPVVVERLTDDVPLGAVTPDLLEYLREAGVRSAVVIPITIAGQRVGALVVETVRSERAWPAPLVGRLRLLAEILSGASHRARQQEALRHSQADVARLTAALEIEPVRVSEARAARFGVDDIIGESAVLKAVLERVREVTPTHSTVLLLGETGTGKELIARALHTHGPRHTHPLISVNCAALPPTLIESELFGHERGAFTGAVATRPGRFQLAHQGTLFLDEIGDLPRDLQSKLLRVLQEGEFERIGSSHTQKVNVRIVAATHRDLARAVAEGEFRDDLYYRLSVFPIRLPSLRERREDIPALVWFIIHKRQRAMQRWIKNVPDPVMDTLQRHSWPGNVRELENVIERALIHSPGNTLRLLDDSFDSPLSPPPADRGTLSAVERTHIEEVLRDCRWRINGTGNAAERLGLHPNTLRFRMRKLGIVRGNAV